MRFRVPAFLLWKKPAEHSVPYRVATLATVLCGIAAILHEQEWPSFSWLVIAGTVGGSILSYRRRECSNWGLKVLLSVLMLVALSDFLANLVYSPHDPRVPLANLLLWLQTLHSFDLPARRDLNYSLLVGFILINVAGVLSHDLSYLPFMVAFVACAVVTMQYNHVSQASEGVEVHGGGVPVRLVLRQACAMTVALGLLGGMAFLVIPRFDGMRIRSMPMSFNLKLPNLSQGQIQNPAYPETGGRVAGHRQLRRFDSESYMGFNSFVDLNLRGRMSDEITMRVRSSEETYYRGLAFNVYTGEGWEMSEEEPQKRTAANPPVFVEPEAGGAHEITQIFYIEKEMANVVFGAYHPFQIYFPSEMLYIDRHSGVRAPYPLQPGLVYSVVSLTKDSGTLSSRALARHRAAAGRRMDFVRRAREYDLNLPASLPRRVRDLALEITSDRRSTFAKSVAIATYLKSRCQYDLDVPAFPPGHDVVDEFLFEQRRGYCEHFATSMVVLCRSVGVPARLVTGYLPGTYNPFTGYYEVKCADAHAWVEVMVDSYGWVAFDPTPGYEGVVSGRRHERGRWVLGSLLSFLQQRLGVDEAAWQRLQQQLLDTVSRLRSAGVVGWGILAMVPLVLVLGLAWVVRRLARPLRAMLPVALARRQESVLGQVLEAARRLLAGRSEAVEEQDGVATAWREMCALLRERGCVRESWQTPREFGEAAGRVVPRVADPAREMAELYTRACYGRGTVSEADVAASRACVVSLQGALHEPQPAAGGAGDGHP